jgi:hypothetical protein
MVVALISLVFAATGTGIAATGAITGADIQNGSITSADLATGAVTSADLATGAVTSSDIRDSTVVSKDIVNGTIGTADLSKATVTKFDPAVGIQKVLDAKPPVTGATGAAGAAGANGIAGAPGVSWNTVNADFAAAASGATRWYGISGPGELTFAAAATTTPTIPGTISDGRVELLQAPSPSGLDLISVTLFAAVGAPTITAASCSFNPNTETGCTIPGNVTVPAGSRVAWRVLGVKAGAIPTFDAFKVGLAYTISTLG